jgi:hypothetical protein
MVWLVQNCRSNKCLIPKIPRASGGLCPLGPYQGYTLDQLGSLSGPQTPRLLTPLLTKNPGSVPVSNPTNRLFLQLVEQELLTPPPGFSGVRVTRSLVLCVCFVDRCLSFCTFSFGHCVVSSSSIYGFWLPPWYLQTLLNIFLPYKSTWKSAF